MRKILEMSQKQIPKKRQIGLLIIAVLLLALIIIISQIFLSILILETEVEFTNSLLQSNNESSTEYRKVSVDVYLYNPGGPRRTTVWVEITNQVTNVSFSKTESVQIDYKQPMQLTIEFILDKFMYPGEFDHRI